MLTTVVLRLELASESRPGELVKTDGWAPPPGVPIRDLWAGT